MTKTYEKENENENAQTTGALIRARLPDVRQILMMVALTAVVASKAWAGDIAPRAESVVTADVVTVGDVFAGVTRHADHVLAPAPALGQEMTLSAHDLTRISEAFGFGWRPQSGMDRVVIRRDAREIDRYQIEAALQERLAAELPGRKFELQIDGQGQGFFIPPQQAPVLTVARLDYDLGRNTFSAVLAAGGTTRHVGGQLHLLAEVPVLQYPVRSGDIIRAEDVTYVDMRESEMNAKTVLDAAQVIGQSARRSLPALRPLSSADIVAPVLVKKGDLVMVTLQDSVLHLTAQAKALENGADGATVRVMNTSSRQVLEAVVTGPQSVAVRLPGFANGT